MDKEQALHKFWSSFGWKAYDENTVPDNAMAENNYRYITYSVGTDSLDNTLLLTASLWNRSNSWEDVDKKSHDIARFIETQVPPSIRIDNGRLKIRKGTPFAQRMADEDDSIRRIVLSIIVEFLTNY